MILRGARYVRYGENRAVICIAAPCNNTAGHVVYHRTPEVLCCLYGMRLANHRGPDREESGPVPLSPPEAIHNDAMHVYSPQKQQHQVCFRAAQGMPYWEDMAIPDVEPRPSICLLLRRRPFWPVWIYTQARDHRVSLVPIFTTGLLHYCTPHAVVTGGSYP